MRVGVGVGVRVRVRSRRSGSFSSLGGRWSSKSGRSTVSSVLPSGFSLAMLHLVRVRVRVRARARARVRARARARVTRGPEEAEGAAEPSRVAYGPIDHVAHIEEGHLSGWARGWGVGGQVPQRRRCHARWGCCGHGPAAAAYLPRCRAYTYYLLLTVLHLLHLLHLLLTYYTSFGFEPPRAWPCSLKVMEKACGGSSSFLPAVRASQG